MVHGGVSLATIRKRLGHANLQTVLRYAEQSDQVADTELRAWRRRDLAADRVPGSRNPA
jgi:integrase/recombinase XerD